MSNEPQKDGICYRCMYDEHKHCYHTSNGRNCTCEHAGHDLNRAIMRSGMNPDFRPQRFPEEPGEHDRFYFVAQLVSLQ